MSFIAKLQLQNEDELNVLRCDYRFYKNTSITGTASTRALGGVINVTLASINHPGLFEWMIHKVQTKNGKITFIRYDTMSKLKILEFENAICVTYHEMFDSSGEHPMLLQLTMSAHTVKLEDAVYKNNWPGLG
jgi:hypothetical protein